MDTLPRKLACAAVVSTVLATSVARAAAPPYTPMPILGIGNHSCGDYLRSAEADRKARPADSNAQDMFFDLDHGLYMAWVDGYLTAANSYDPDKRMAGQNTTHLARGQWLEKFCGDHPQSPFLAAVNALHDASGVPPSARPPLAESALSSPATTAATGSKTTASAASATGAQPTANDLPTAPGNYRVQLASLKTEADANNAWKLLSNKYKDLLGPLSVHLEKADLGTKGVYYRVQAGPFSDRATARDICVKLKAKGQQCLVRP